MFFKIICFMFLFFVFTNSYKIFAAEKNTPSVSKEILPLLEEYKELRKEKKKHYNTGEFNHDLDAWDGRMHNVMIELGDYFGKPIWKKSDIINFLGEPDATEKKNGEEKLVYFWRGWHDYLYFTCKNGIIQSSEWYFAFE